MFGSVVYMFSCTVWLESLPLISISMLQENELDVSHADPSSRCSDPHVSIDPVEDVSASMDVTSDDVDLTNLEAGESSVPQASAPNKVCLLCC